jgi:glycosyltransferase involved in cell wall biosynthesis
VKLRVSVIIPCFNEERTIAQVLEALQRQTFPLADMEVVIADGMSTDGTRRVIQAFAGEHPGLAVRLVANPARIIPAALNRAIEQARGEVIIRLDAHALPHPDYIERSLQVLESTGAANAGGIWEIRPSKNGWLARSIAAAAAHRLGAGDARYRTLGKAGPADTVPFGAFRREWLERIGPFDESLISNEDYELNVRLRRVGGLIWLDPSIRSVYFARGDLLALSRQYARYGFWKTRMLVRNVDTIRWRQALPPAFILAASALAVLGTFWHPAWALLGVQWAVYAMASGCAGAAEAVTRKDLGLLLGFPLAIWTMHLSWGGGFLWGLATWLLGGRDERRGA